MLLPEHVPKGVVMFLLWADDLFFIYFISKGCSKLLNVERCSHELFLQVNSEEDEKQRSLQARLLCNLQWKLKKLEIIVKVSPRPLQNLTNCLKYDVKWSDAMTNSRLKTLKWYPCRFSKDSASLSTCFNQTRFTIWY